MNRAITVFPRASLLMSAGIGPAGTAEWASGRYRCDKGIVLEAVYGNSVNTRSTVRNTVAGESYLLMRERAASGVRFRADGWTWWSRGNRGVFLSGQQTIAANCQQLAD